MKRYDTDEDMHKALEVFIFDTLTDPALELADAPEEPACNLEKVVTYTLVVGDLEFTVNNLPETRSAKRALVAMLMAPAKGVSKEERHQRMLIAQACINSLLEG